MLAKPEIAKVMNSQQNDITKMSVPDQKKKRGPPQIAGQTVYENDADKAEMLKVNQIKSDIRKQKLADEFAQKEEKDIKSRPSFKREREVMDEV